MQYKIPVQVENEDPILLGLSLRQLVIIIVGGGLAYSLFKSLHPKVGGEIAAIPSIGVFVFFVLVAVVKLHEMTFVHLVLAILRFNVNSKNRRWDKGVDSMQAFDIGYIVNNTGKKEEKVDFQSKMDKIKELEEKIDKI